MWIVAAQGLAKASNRDDAVWASRVQPALTARVAEDDDVDCKFFAQIALDACA